MDVYMIWAHEAGSAWLVESWDDDSIAGNGDRWNDAKERAYKDYSAENVRIIKARVDFDKVLAAFTPAETTLTMQEEKS